MDISNHEGVCIWFDNCLVWNLMIGLNMNCGGELKADWNVDGSAKVGVLNDCNDVEVIGVDCLLSDCCCWIIGSISWDIKGQFVLFVVLEDITVGVVDLLCFTIDVEHECNL